MFDINDHYDINKLTVQDVLKEKWEMSNFNSFELLKKVWDYNS